MNEDRDLMLGLASAMCKAGLSANMTTEPAWTGEGFCVTLILSGFYRADAYSLRGALEHVSVAVCSGKAATEAGAWTDCLDSYLSGRCLPDALEKCRAVGLAASSRAELKLKLSVRDGEARA